MKKTLLGLVVSGVLLLSTAGWAQEVASFAIEYDVDSTTETYCRVLGEAGAWSGSIPGRGLIETSGSSTTVTGVNAADDVFIDVGVGDILLVRDVQGNTTRRVVTAKASADSITINTAVNWSAQVVWRWLNVECGTGANDGWIDLPRHLAAANSGWGIDIQYNAGDLTGGLAARVECRTAGVAAQPVVVYPGEGDGCGVGGTLSGNECQFATAGIDSRLVVVNDFNVYGACRVALSAVTSDSDGTVEQVTVTLIGR